jgi:hypothetical protein
MGYLIHAIYYLLSLIPGGAARTHLRSGCMGRRLRSAMASAGGLFVGAAAACAYASYRGYRDWTFGYFPAMLILAVAVFLLLGGIGAIVRAIRNPAPPTADNVIPFRRPVEPARDLHRYRRWEK